MTSAWTVAGLAGLAPQDYPGPSLGAFAGSMTIMNNYPACTNTGANRSIGQWVEMWLDTNLIQGWVDGTIENYGLALTASESDKWAWKRFTSSNHASGLYAPKLYLTYNGIPQVEKQYPPFGYTAPTLTPELVVLASDADQQPQPLTYRFLVYDSAGTTLVADSGSFQPSRSWAVSSGALRWGQTYWWTVIAWDGQTASTSQKAQLLTTQVPQPPITSNLSQNADGNGFEPSIGNFTTSAIDAQVETVGPALAIERSYNSRDPRTTGAFGAGWSSVVDAKVVEHRNTITAQVERLVVTYPSGQEVPVGRNPDGTFVPPLGRAFTFAAVAGGGYELTDKDGIRLAFTTSLGASVYGITSVTDAKARALNFTYVGAQVTSITSAASGRVLHLTWLTPSGTTTPRVASISTDEAVEGDPATVSTWNYQYTNATLTGVCPPTSMSACSSYSYASNSLFPAAILDSRPHTYLRFGEASGATADNTVVDSLEAATGTYGGVTLGQPGGLAGSAATAAGFNGSSSFVELTAGRLALDSSYQTVSMWFKTSTPESVLFSYRGDNRYAAGRSPLPPAHRLGGQRRSLVRLGDAHAC